MGADVIDWELAAATGRRLVPAGPRVSYGEAAAVVGEVTELTIEAESHVRAFTGLAADETPGAPVVLDRPGWLDSNVEGFRLALGPFLQRVAERRGDRTGGGMVNAVGSRVTAVQVGSILAFLASKVLGQYEIFVPPTELPGRLTLVAPNIVATERALDVNPRDFRLWVCLHESTHRTQFVAVPWLREHVLSEIGALIEATDVDPAALARRMRSAMGSLRNGERTSMIEMIQTPEQRAVLDRLTGVMSLLEGHAEFVMDGVGPGVIPTVASIRERFDQRRGGGGVIERFLRRLLGVDLKLRQYADGRRFVSTVVDAVGQEEFNRVWTTAAALPSRDEIAHPHRWIDRVLERPAVSA